MSAKNESDVEINFLGKPSRGKTMRVNMSLLNIPGLDLDRDVLSIWNYAAVKTILGKIALPCRDDGAKFTDTRRLDAIAACVGEKWRLFVDGNLCRIYAQGDFDPQVPAVVVSSHVDMVASRCYADCGDELWKGSFDNLITNAAVVTCMEQTLFRPNVLVAFTGDEEVDSKGVDEVVQSLRKKGVRIGFAIATDVTGVGWNEGKHFTIENIFPDDGQSVADLLSRWLPFVSDIDTRPIVVVEGEGDEAWQYDEHDLKCCSVCLPCRGDMHSEEGVEVRSVSVAIYTDALRRFANVWNEHP